MTKGFDVKEFLQSFDDTVTKIENDIETLSKDFLALQDRTS